MLAGGIDKRCEKRSKYLRIDPRGCNKADQKHVYLPFS